MRDRIGAVDLFFRGGTNNSANFKTSIKYSKSFTSTPSKTYFLMLIWLLYRGLNAPLVPFLVALMREHAISLKNLTSIIFEMLLPFSGWLGQILNFISMQKKSIAELLIVKSYTITHSMC